MKKILNYSVALTIYAMFLLLVYKLTVGNPLDFTKYEAYKSVIFKGWITTITISVVSLILALVIGLIIYFMQISRFGVISAIAGIHKTIVFGTPLPVLSMVAFYYIGNAFSITSKFWVGVVTLGLYIGAYIADIYKAAIEAIHPNQWQTAKMFGFTKYQTYRYVIFPQVVTGILPPLAGQFAMTIKSSAILAYLATDEFFNTIRTVQSLSFKYLEGFIIVTIGYLLLTVPLIALVRYLESRLKFRGGMDAA